MHGRADDGMMASDSRLDLLATVLADDGPAAHEATVADFVAHVRAEGLQHVALDVLADPGRPDVVRQRAFGVVHAALLAFRPGTPPAHPGRSQPTPLILC